MIELKVMPECHYCADFEPIAETKTFFEVDKNDSLTKVCTEVRCKNYEKCHEIISYLEFKMMEKENETNN